MASLQRDRKFYLSTTDTTQLFLAAKSKDSKSFAVNGLINPKPAKKPYGGTNMGSLHHNFTIGEIK